MTARWLEFHDSDIKAIEAIGDVVEVRLAAYVHQWERTPEGPKGTGWIVPVCIRVTRADVPSAIEMPAEVWSGEVWSGGQRIDLVPLPFDASGDVGLTAEMRSGARLELRGNAISAFEVPGESRYVERLADDLMPDDWSE